MCRGSMGDVQSLVFQVWSSTGNQAIDRGAQPPRASGVGTEAADWGALQLGALGMCAWAAWPLIWVHTYLGFWCMLGLLIPLSQSRG